MTNNKVVDKLHDIADKCGDLNTERLDKIRDAIEEDEEEKFLWRKRHV